VSAVGHGFKGSYGALREIRICRRDRDNQKIEQPWLRRATGWFVPEKNPTRVVYGIITVGALMAAESGHHETYADAVASAFIAAGLYWLLHAYSDVLGRRLAGGEPLRASVLARGLTEESAILRGAAVPLSALVIAWATGASQETGVTVALWTAAASIVAFELAAGVRSHATRAELVLEVAVGVGMGAAIFALKIVLH
jgi:hypothetical protein